LVEPIPLGARLAREQGDPDRSPARRALELDVQVPRRRGQPAQEDAIDGGVVEEGQLARGEDLAPARLAGGARDLGVAIATERLRTVDVEDPVVDPGAAGNGRRREPV